MKEPNATIKVVFILLELQDGYEDHTQGLIINVGEL